MKTSNMFDREREEIIKFMIYCNITKKFDAFHPKSNEEVLQSQAIDDKRNLTTDTNVGSSLSISVQFRKQVKIHVLDR